MTKTIEIKAVFIRERIRFDGSDTIIGDIRLVETPQNGFVFGDHPLSIKGEANIDQLRPLGTYLFYGSWSKYTNKRTSQTENQFRFVSFVESQPLDRDSVISYLQAKGKGCGVGRARAVKMVEKFGSSAVKIAREQPDVIAAAIPGVDLENAQALAAALEIDKHREHCHIELMGLMRGRGFPRKTADLAMQEWGNRAPDVIKADPYKLMQFRGCGFKRTDQMYLQLGHSSARMKRQALCAWYSMASDSSGDTWFPIERCAAMIRGQIGSAANPLKAVMLAKRARIVDVRRDPSGKVWVAEAKKSNHEKAIAECLARAAKESIELVDPSWLSGTELRNHQVEQVSPILARKPAVWILGGSPGTGKTFTAAAVIRLLGQKHGWESIAVAAPTGKAAVRITEAMKNNRVPLRAKTIHSLLGVAAADAGGNWGFKHCESNPLPFSFVVVDESSMIDSGLMAALLKARAVGTGIIFIGDVNQLAPVGHGAPLRDMIAAGLPYAELTEIQRNSGRIVQACADIRDGHRFSFSPRVDLAAGENLAVVPADKDEQQIDKMLRSLDSARAQGLDPVWDVQVLCPVNKKSKISRAALNRILQAEMNKNPAVPNCPFRVGDKLVNSKNLFFKSVEFDETSADIQTNEKNEVYVANGELARVLEIDGQVIIAELFNPSRTIQIFRSKQAENQDDGDDGEDDGPQTGCTFDLGYALSVHKFQGSEIPVAVVMLDQYPGAKLVQTREYLYTAISRAKQLCLCVGKTETAYAMVGRRALWNRKTFLADSIKEACA